MNIVGVVLLSLALAQQGAAVGKVETTFDKTANFASFHSYSWTPGWKADNPDAATLIMAACEAEMAKLGFTKAESGADVTLAYYTVRSTEVDLKALDKVEKAGGGPTPTKTLGRLVVVMRSGTARTQLWSASTREFVDPDPVKMGETIRAATTRLFESYPGRKAAGR